MEAKKGKNLRDRRSECQVKSLNNNSEQQSIGADGDKEKN
jgi:hypothetical protein